MPTALNLSSEEIQQLKYERYTYHDMMIQKRLNAIYLKSTTDLNDCIIAQVSGCHRNSISGWVDQCVQKGLWSLYTNDYRNPESILEEYREQIFSCLDEHPVQSINQAVALIKELTGIERGPTQVRQFLLRHDYQYRKMGQIPAKADVQKQEEWLVTKLNPYIEQAQKGLCHLLFCDAAHFTLGAFICMVWCRVRIFLKTAAGRNRINVLGAVHAITKQVTTHINTTYVNAQTMMDFLLILKEQYADLPIVLVLDNARYQHCQAVLDKAKSMDITLLFLPAYSPNLNIIERLWKFTKKKILYAKYYDTPDKFHMAVTDFFMSVNRKYQTELNSLLSLKFQLWKKQDAQNLAA